MVGQWPLEPRVQVRILPSQLFLRLTQLFLLDISNIIPLPNKREGHTVERKSLIEIIYIFCIMPIEI